MNKTNLELKHYCPDFKPVREILKQLGVKKELVKKQKDYFFNLPVNKKQYSGRLKMRLEASKKTLIYYERPDFMKGKETAADIKLYEVKDKNLLVFLERSLGVQAIVEKSREVWRKGTTVFHLDDVKGVGMIFEIELQKYGRITTKDQALFKSYQDTLVPFLGKVIRGSNVDLVGTRLT